MRRIVLADDLTGAADAGVQFALAGLRVRLELVDLRSVPSDDASDVLAYSTNSRALPPSEAYRRTRDAAMAAGDHSVYKKVDSTLRGNLGAEIDAVLDATGCRAALLSPALPEQRRTVVNGHLLVGGTAVSRTAFAEDPSTPARESHIPTMLSQQSRRKAGVIDSACVSRGPIAVRARISALLDSGATIVVADAVRDADLETLVAASARIEPPLLLCGSAGLAAALAHREPRGNPDRPAAIERVVVVVGSVNPVAIAQAEVLSRRARWPAIRLDPTTALAGSDAWRAWLGNVRSELEGTAGGMVLSVAGEPGAARAEAKSEVAMLAERLAELAEIAIASIGAGGAILTGGDTAAAVLRRLAARAVDLIGELERGVPFGWVRGGSRDGLAVATKAGGFGEPDVLWRAASRLSGGADTR